MSDKLDKIKTIVENNKNSAVGPMDVLRPTTEWATPEEHHRRFSICNSCPEMVRLTKQCKKCGCFMIVKTKLKEATCPLEKW